MATSAEEMASGAMLTRRDGDDGTMLTRIDGDVTRGDGEWDGAHHKR